MLTPREYQALNRQFIAREERQDRRFAVMYVMYCNAHRDTAKKPDPFTLEDFMPTGKPVSQMSAEEYFLAEAKKHMSAEQQAIMARGYSEAFKQ